MILDFQGSTEYKHKCYLVLKISSQYQYEFIWFQHIEVDILLLIMLGRSPARLLVLRLLCLLSQGLLLGLRDRLR